MYINGDNPSGGGTPGGADSNVQYNNGGAFGGDSLFVWDDTNKFLGVGIGTPIVPLDVVLSSAGRPTPSSDVVAIFQNDVGANTNAYISVIADDTGGAGMIMGDSAGSTRARVEWNGDPTFFGLILESTDDTIMSGASLSMRFGDGAGGQEFIDLNDTQLNTDVRIFSEDGTTLYRSDASQNITTIEGALIINEAGADYDVKIETDGDPNNIYSNGGTNNTGFGTNTPDPAAKIHVVSTTMGAIPIPAMTTAQRAAIAAPAAAVQAYDTDQTMSYVYDSQRFRAQLDMGWMPYAYPINFVADAAFTTAITLPNNGGSIAIPVVVSGHMLLQSVSVRNTDTATAREWRWDLYTQYLNNGNSGENTLTRIAASNGSEAFTPIGGLPSSRTLAAASAPVYLPPGTYWLVIQSTHATSSFGLGSSAVSAAFRFNTAQTKTTTNPNGSTLDFVAATWTKDLSVHAVRLNGRVFGQTTAF